MYYARGVTPPNLIFNKMTIKKPTSKEKAFKKLQKENEKIRARIDEIIGINYPAYSPLWLEIGNLIENELEQEELCGE